jgi:DNA-binding transcriptional LysR family regulator
MNDRLSSEALAAFAVFAEHRNFTRAAEELHISQPALHVKVRNLARTLGRPLYRREGRRLELTPEGQAVARFARQLDDQFAVFLSELAGAAPTRPVVLAAGEGAFLYVLSGAVRQLLDASGLRLRLRTCHRDDMLEAIRSGQAQLGVGVLEVLPDDLEVVVLATYPQVALLQPIHPLARHRSLLLADLTGAQLILPPPGRPHRVALERALRAATVNWSLTVEAEGWPLMAHFAALGVGVAIVNGCVRPGPDAVARTITDLPEVAYLAVHRLGALDDPRVARVLATIQAHLP